MRKINFKNENELKALESEQGVYLDLDNFPFKLEIDEEEALVESFSISEIHAHFLKLAIDFIEQNEYYDDYDDFNVKANIYFERNDGERIVYNVDISVEVEN